MTKNFYGNMPAFRHMENYIKLEHPGPLILSGKQGLGKRQAAFSLAASLLDCSEDAMLHSRDFLLIDKGNEAIKVEDIFEILEQSNLTSLGAVRVYLICRAEKMNAQAQNKLLKLLEDRNTRNIVIFVCEQDALLDTIKSRCMTIDFSPLSDSEMETYLEEHNVKDDRNFIGYLCDNCPYRLEDALTVYPKLKNIFQEILSIKRKKELLSVFHLIKEKDSMEFYSVFAEHYHMALLMLQYLFYDLLLVKLNAVPSEVKNSYSNLTALYTVNDTHKICVALTNHQRQWLSGIYTKNDFFDLVRIMI